MDWHGRRVTVMGLGRHGGAIGAIRFLASRGADVTVTDTADEAALRESLDQIADLPNIRFELGGHQASAFRDADVVVANPAVRPDDRHLQLAADNGATVTTEIELLLGEVSAHTVAITGSNGKSTTAAMLDAVLRASGHRTWLGGNLGGSLLQHTDSIKPDDWLILELSSFQLHRLSSAIRPFDVAIVTSCTPNHLDWHPDVAHYIRAKRRILELTAPSGCAVLNMEDAEVQTWVGTPRGMWRAAVDYSRIPLLRVPGEHNRTNARLAAAAALAIGCSTESVQTGLSQFQGLQHRLELIAEIDGRRFINDSAATTPESTIAAINALGSRSWLVAGGSDKGADFHAMARAITEGVQGVAFYGAVGPTLQRACDETQSTCPRTVVPTLDEALQWCWQRAQSGDTILLSPGCASSDQFDHYIHRADVFRQLVKRLQSISGERTLA